MRRFRNGEKLDKWFVFVGKIFSVQLEDLLAIVDDYGQTSTLSLMEFLDERIQEISLH